MFWSAGCSLLGAEGSWSLDVFYGGLGRSKNCNFSLKIINFVFSAVNFLSIFSNKNPGSELYPDPDK